MFKKELLNKIYLKDSMSGHIVFSHADKTWVIPEDGVKVGMDMYQPSTCMGKKLKKRVLKGKSAPFFAKNTEISKESIKLNSLIEEKIKEMIDISDMKIATFMGDSSSFQNNKATMQIYRDDRIFAYIKITTDEKIFETLKKEAKLLEKLSSLGIKNIPRVLGLDKTEEFYLFAQSTDKPVGQEVKLEFGKQQIDFIKDITDQTKTKINYEETDFYKSVNYLKENLMFFDEVKRKTLQKAINEIEKLSGEIDVAFFHGDYTPWNVYYKDEEIYAFDFEYCSETMIPYMDLFHYITQLSRMGLGNTATGTVRFFEHQCELLKDTVEDIEFTYTCYLVWVISFYHKRSVKKEQENFEYWIEILDYLNEYNIWRG